MKIGNKHGLVDARSNPLTPVHFDAVAWAGPGAKNVKIDGKRTRIGLDGRWLLEPKFDYLSGGIDNFVASIDGKRGFMLIGSPGSIEPKFDAARLRGPDTAFVSISGATGVLRLADQSWAVGLLRCHVRSDAIHVANRRQASDPIAHWRDLDHPCRADRDPPRSRPSNLSQEREVGAG